MVITRVLFSVTERATISLFNLATITYLKEKRGSYSSYFMWAHIGASVSLFAVGLLASHFTLNICGVTGDGYYIAFVWAQAAIMLSSFAVPWWWFKYEYIEYCVVNCILIFWWNVFEMERWRRTRRVLKSPWISLPRSSISSEEVLFRLKVMKRKRKKLTILKEVSRCWFPNRDVNLCFAHAINGLEITSNINFRARILDSLKPVEAMSSRVAYFWI